MLRTFLAWLPMVPLAVANGAFRELVLRPRMAELRAHQLSTLMLAALTGAWTAFAVRRWRPASGRAALGLGAAWAALTVAFEFGLGRAAGHPWPRLLQDYDLSAGRLWGPYLLWLALAPWLLRRRGTRS